VAYEHKDLRHGIFFHYVLEGLRGKAKDDEGAVTWDSLVQHVKRQVTRQVPKLVNKEAAQHPAEIREDSGEPPVLLRPADLAPTVVRTATLTSSSGIKLVLIRPGNFLMGSSEGERGRYANEGPRHRVTIRAPFYLGASLVTVGQFRQFVAATKYRTDAEKDGGASVFDLKKEDYLFRKGASWRKPGFAQGEAHPVVHVSWHDAVAFCAWLGRKDRATYRLPTEAEWEYACRAGSSTRYWSGDAEGSLRGVANCYDRSLKGKVAALAPWCCPWDDGHPFTSPVGRFRANPWGLYDMHGNVYQWCSDWYADDYPNGPRTDPTGPPSGTQKVIRGGSWVNSTRNLRAAHRFGCDPRKAPSDNIGFRIVRVP
jgi:formylglycine-generating enzyme required for sulfatase activity